MKDPATAVGGNGTTYLTFLTVGDRVTPGNDAFCILFTSASDFCPIPGFSPFVNPFKPPGSPESAPRSLDNPLVSADPSPSALPVEAPRRDRVYIHWTDADFGIEFTRSIQAGVEGTFLDPQVELHLLPNGHDILEGPVSAVGPDGELYVA